MSSIDVNVIHARKAQWSEVVERLQKRTRELNDELFGIQGQVAQLSGAIQACDVLLADVDSQQEPPTLDNNG